MLHSLMSKNVLRLCFFTANSIPQQGHHPSTTYQCLSPTQFWEIQFYLLIVPQVLVPHSNAVKFLTLVQMLIWFFSQAQQVHGFFNWTMHCIFYFKSCFSSTLRIFHNREKFCSSTREKVNLFISCALSKSLSTWPHWRSQAPQMQNLKLHNAPIFYSMLSAKSVK